MINEYKFFIIFFPLSLEIEPGMKCKVHEFPIQLFSFLQKDFF